MLNVSAAEIALATDFLDDIDEVSEEELLSTINDTARETELRAINRSASELTLPATYIRNHIRVVQIATPSRPEAKVQANEKQTNLARFKHTKVEGGVLVERRKGRTDFIEGAFLFTSRSGTPLIGLSKTRLKTKYPRVRINSGRSRNQVLYGPTPNQIFLSKGPPIPDEILERESVRFLNRLLNTSS